jgi:glycosyltransferase involved in cell wall biosynthesis
MNALQQPENAHQKSEKIKILAGAPVKQKPLFLTECLESLKRLDKAAYEMDFIFIDDNENEQSTQLLKSFCQEREGSLIIPGDIISSQAYICDNVTHYWKEEIIWKVAAFKDKILDYAREHDYDYAFLLDSDVVLHPKTIDTLLKAKKDIVASIMWTSWLPGSPPMPQAWVSDRYNLFEHHPEERLTLEEITKRQNIFLNKLKQPGTYEVGGLAACTLISKFALNKGVSFKKIKNLTIWGEDRHFCIRAVALGLSLFMDTHYPAFHIYRDSDMEDVKKYKERTLS